MARFQFMAMSLSLGGTAAPTRRRARSWVDELDSEPLAEGDAPDDGPGWYASSAELRRGLTVFEAPPAD